MLKITYLLQEHRCVNVRFKFLVNLQNFLNVFLYRIRISSRFFSKLLCLFCIMGRKNLFHLRVNRFFDISIGLWTIRIKYFFLRSRNSSIILLKLGFVFAVVLVKSTYSVYGRDSKTRRRWKCFSVGCIWKQDSLLIKRVAQRYFGKLNHTKMLFTWFVSCVTPKKFVCTGTNESKIFVCTFNCFICEVQKKTVLLRLFLEDELSF